MSLPVEHVQLPTASLFVTDETSVVTRLTSITPVVQVLQQAGIVASWGPNNDHPQRVADDKRRVTLIAAVINKKSDMLVNGNIRYGKVVIDQDTGFERMIPVRDPEVEQFLRASNVRRYLRESTRNWYTYYNVFVELVMNKAGNKIARLGCQDPCHVRLGAMDDKGEINQAFIHDWVDDPSGSGAFEINCLDPYGDVPYQIRQRKQARYILPIRDLVDGQFYYGEAPYDGLRANGWLDVIKRVPLLKKQLLNNLMHLRYHIEIDERFWELEYPGFSKKEVPARVELAKEYVRALNTWMKDGNGQGGSFMSRKLFEPNGKEQSSLVTITDKTSKILEGAYIEDSQEAEFILCRDMGLKPSLIGISPSKSGSSPGSGSEDRVARTNHILDSKSEQDMLLEALYHTRDINGWNPEYEFWLAGYYAATQDRTSQVDKQPNAGPEH